jgi:hypothetical protein
VTPQRHSLAHTSPHEAIPPLLLLTIRTVCLAPAAAGAAAVRVLPVLPHQAAAAALLLEHPSGPTHNDCDRQR